MGESPSSICDNVPGGGGSFFDLAIRAQIELRNVKVKVTLMHQGSKKNLRRQPGKCREAWKMTNKIIFFKKILFKKKHTLTSDMVSLMKKVHNETASLLRCL